MDFYDTNNDEKISELDLYKIFSIFGQQDTDHANTIFKYAISKDLLVLSKLLRWLQQEKQNSAYAGKT